MGEICFMQYYYHNFTQFGY